MNNERNGKTGWEEFHNYLMSQQNAWWMDNSRRWWPKFFFHFTNIDNAVNILKRDKLLSRNQLNKIGCPRTDIASDEIIDQTDSEWLDYVRLFFRPRTPTQYHNEGFRPRVCIYQTAHCPFPVYFLFDSKLLLEREELFFSNGSLASPRGCVFSDINSFKNIPFRLVYHDGYFDPWSAEGRDIIFHKQAEIIKKDSLSLSGLRYIMCRSEAEYNTLIYLLSLEGLEEWPGKIGSSNESNLFQKDWIYIKNVHMTNTEMIFYISLGGKYSKEPIDIRIEIMDYESKQCVTWAKGNYELSEKIHLKLGKELRHYSVYAYFDDSLMFADEFVEEEDIPF